MSDIVARLAKDGILSELHIREIGIRRLEVFVWKRREQLITARSRIIDVYSETPDGLGLIAA